MFSRSIARPLLVLIQVPLIAMPAAATWVMDYTGQLSPNFHEQRCKRPVAVTFAPQADELCVTDVGLRSLRVYSGAGVFSFATGELARLSQPADAVLDGEGGFIVIDRDRERGCTLRRLDFRGEPADFAATAPCPDWLPAHLLRLRDGGLIAVDDMHRLLSKHDGLTGALLWSQPIAADAQDTDRDLALGRPAEAADGRLYLPSGALHCVLVFDAEGRSLEAFGHFGSARGQLSFPTGVAFGPDGLLLVLDRLRHVVLLFDGQHRFLAEYGSFGGGPGQFYHPSAIAAAPDGRVFIAQGYEGRVQSFRLHSASDEASLPLGVPAGRSQLQVTLNSQPWGCGPLVPFVGDSSAPVIDFVLQCVRSLNPSA